MDIFWGKGFSVWRPFGESPCVYLIAQTGGAGGANYKRVP
jgi:hypothetical protein